MKDLKSDRAERKRKQAEAQLKKNYSQLHKENERLLAEQEAVLSLKRHKSTIFRIEERKTRSESEATAVVLASDWHVEETVVPSTVNGLNKYDTSIAKTRAAMFFERVNRLVKKEQQDVSISTLVLWLGGDFISSNIHDELLESCSLRPIDAMLLASDLIESGINYILANSALNLVIPCSCGNHSRITKKVHVGTERGNSLEWMMYHHLAKKFAGEKRVKFIIEDAYHTYVDVYDFKVRFHHGHAVRYQGGIGGLHIPLNKAIAAWNNTIDADVDCMGHWHTYTPSRSYVVNGSMIGYNAFAVWIKAPFEPPIQAMFLIDKKRGVTVQMPVLL